METGAGRCTACRGHRGRARHTARARAPRGPNSAASNAFAVSTRPLAKHGRRRIGPKRRRHARPLSLSSDGRPETANRNDRVQRGALLRRRGLGCPFGGFAGGGGRALGRGLSWPGGSASEPKPVCGRDHRRWPLVSQLVRRNPTANAGGLSRGVQLDTDPGGRNTAARGSRPAARKTTTRPGWGAIAGDRRNPQAVWIP